MNSETNSSGTDTTLKGQHAKRPVAEMPRASFGAKLFGRLEQSGVVSFVLLMLPVLVGAAVLSPHIGNRVYPTNIKMIGTPAPEKIKAPYDFEVTDTDTTSKLRTEAAQNALRVFDFDTALAKNIATRIGQAFDEMEQRKKTFLEERPEHASGRRLSRSMRQQLETEIQEVLEEARPRFEEILQLPLTPQEHELLHQRQFAMEIGSALVQAIEQVGASPIIAERSIVESDRNRGITIQRVPDDHGPEKIIKDVDTISDLQGAKRRLIGLLASSLPKIQPEHRQILAELGGRLLKPNLTLNRQATEIAREVAALSVKPIKIGFKEHEVIVRDGERISNRQLLAFAELNQRSSRSSPFLVAAGGVLLMLVLLFASLLLGRSRRWTSKLAMRDMAFLATVLCLALIGMRLWLLLLIELQETFSTVPSELFLYLVPVAAGAMIVRMVMRVEIALTFGVILSLVFGFMAETTHGYVLYAVMGSVLGATSIQTMSRRSDLLRAGTLVGAGQMVLALALYMFDANTNISGYSLILVAAFLSGPLAATITLAMTAVVEAVFGYTTDLNLLELANLNHPAMKELIVQAPGSYHHSAIVGSLAEAAAEAIGANALLARVMAYYHDVGKSCNPGYFIENQRGGQNPHNKIKPSMSAMIIRRHVHDGLDIAKRYHLGEQIMAGIAEHHGTSLIQFFYQKAKEHEDPSNPVAEQDYRYPGRKPQSKEAALVMLADAIEAASRSLAEPTKARLQGVVNRIVNMKFTDGQLEDSDLTLRDLHSMAKAFTPVLVSIYHERPEYPNTLEQRTRKKNNGDSDTKVQKRVDKRDAEDKEERPENLRRLGLD